VGAKAQLGTALLKSYSGEFLLPTPETIQAAAAALTPRTPPDQRLTLVNAPGAHAYPLTNYEYAVVSTKQANTAIAVWIRRFLLWAIAPDETNEKYLQDAQRPYGAPLAGRKGDLILKYFLVRKSILTG
jgi:phosphate transport system substrate-binding protein